MLSGCKLFAWFTAIIIVLTLIGVVMFVVMKPEGMSGGFVLGYVITMGINVAILSYMFKMYKDCAGRQDIIAKEFGQEFRKPKAFEEKIQALKKGNEPAKANE